jgi:NADPH-dependent 2,4-dienoyl-CoA reductase/sulfur reductase-like enzyme
VDRTRDRLRQPPPAEPVGPQEGGPARRRLPYGTRLFGLSLREVADRLRFVATPKRRQYDVSIYGAGPAGLSAAVYAASEGLSTVLFGGAPSRKASTVPT